MQFGMYMTHIAIMFLLRASRPQYSQPVEWPQSGGRSEAIVCNSAALTAECSDGSLRNHVCQIVTQMRPTPPRQTKIARHDRKFSSHNTSTGVSPPTMC